MGVVVKQFINVDFSANSYALKSGSDIALIDVGTATPELIDYTKNNAENIKYILLTHDHFDHIGAVAEILKHCNAKVCIHKNDQSGLTNSKYNLGNMMGVQIPKIFADVILSNGDKLPFGEGEIRVIHTPGHTDGSVCYIFDNIMFSGDTLFFESVGRTDFITGDPIALMKSLKRIVSLKGIDKVYTGHGEPTTIEHERMHNFYLNYEGIY